MKRVTPLIPLTFNDGTAVPEALLERIEDHIVVAFNGWTVVGEVSGAYRMAQAGHKQVDRLLHVWIIVEAKELPSLRQMVSGFGALLEQELMYFEIADTQVEFLPPLGGSESHE
jgi:hypothetical protein